jgi:hypothetical protein
MPRQVLAPIIATILVFLPLLCVADSVADAALYVDACAACHGSDGTGRSAEELVFEPLPPDFTDCEFASREPDPDWHAIIHEGGEVRAFDQMMPAFGDALSDDEIYSILRHVRTFCIDKTWPAGEFNLPRALYTEKAFPEDEAVVTTIVDTDTSDAITTEFLFEKRFGSVNMIEVAVPMVSRDSISGSGRDRGIGDISLGFKRTIHHNLSNGSIVSAGAEVILPTGDDADGLGKGTTVFEPFITYGQILPNDAFFQAHAFAEFPTDSAFDDEVGLRMALGRTWTTGGPFGRAWSPMIEALLARDLASGADTNLDLVPQVQVSLNTRQHILLSVGVRIPANHTAGRDVEYGVYLLWDWFDGGFFDGW